MRIYFFTGKNMNRFIIDEKTISNNSYINYQLIRYPSELENFSSKNHTLISNTCMDFDQFLSRIIEVDAHNSHSNKGTLPRLGVQLTFLLDYDRDASVISKICDEISNRFENLPYFAYSYKQGNGNYLCMFFSERHFFIEGKPCYYKSDTYRNKKTGMKTSKNDPDAIIEHRAGEMKKSKKFYSNKSTCFKITSKKFFLSWIADLKEWFISLLENKFGASIDNLITLPKFALSGLKTTHLHNALVWNRTLCEVEDSINEVVNVFSVFGFLNDPYLIDSIKLDITNIYEKYCGYLSSGSMHYKHHKNISFSVGTSYNNAYELAHATSVMLDFIKQDKKKLIQKYV